MEWCCGLAAVVTVIAVLGHGAWLVAVTVLNALFGTRPRADEHRSFRYCPGCRAALSPADRYCPQCDLDFDSRRAADLHRVRVAEREVQALIDSEALDAAAGRAVLNQLNARARSLQGLPATPPPPTRPRPARPVVANPPEPVVSVGAVKPLSQADPVPPEPPLRVPVAPKPPEPRRAEPSKEPAQRLPGFLEAHNILWGELVGGLLIVGCSIALVVTLRQTLEAIPYFQFLLSAAVTLGLFGAGQYTLHRWKLRGTSRGMLVIALLLAPLTLLLLAAPFTEGAHWAVDLAVKALALATFVGVVRTGGRDLIGTQHLPGPVDRRWLLSLAVVGAAGTQLLPANLVSPWLPLACFAVACGAILGGLSWYGPRRRDEPVSDRSGTAVLMFVGLAAFALAAAWGLYAVRDALGDAVRLAARLADLAVPLALAGIPVTESGILVLSRVASGGLRAAGTAVALAGFGAVTTALALAWPDPLALLLISGVAGAHLTRVAFREHLSWVQAGAIPLLALAAVLGYHGLAGNWTNPAGLIVAFEAPASGAVLAGFALALGLLAEVLARRGSHQTRSYAAGGLCVGALGLLIVSWNGPDHPVTAAVVHGAVALGLLASNYRWERRAVASAGLWVALVGTLWALWAQAPRQPDQWGFVLAAEAAFLALASVAIRNAHRTATALLRRAGRDVAFGASVLAPVFAISSLAPDSTWHTGTLFALALAFVALARLTGGPYFTWAGSLVALFGCLHLGVFTWGAKPVLLSIETVVLAHGTFMTATAVLCRRQARVFGDPFRWSARLSTALAVPLLLPWVGGYAGTFAVLAVWLGLLWLSFSLLWRERGGFSAFQAAVTLAGLLTALGWAERQEWWAGTASLSDARVLCAFGYALGLLALGWSLARRAVRPVPRARELWCDDPLSLERFVLGATVLGFLLITAAATAPGIAAELRPLAWRLDRLAVPAHAFDQTTFGLLSLLATAVVVSWRLSTLERDTDGHAIGLALVALAAPVVWAGTFAPEVATASALRWGLAGAFLTGTGLVALRMSARRAAEALGFIVRPSPHLHLVLLAALATAAGVVVVLSGLVAELGLKRLEPGGPLGTSAFAQMGALTSNLVPLALVVAGLAVSAARERSAGYALAGGVVFVATLTAGYALSVVLRGNPLNDTEWVHLALVLASSAAVWAMGWLSVERRVPGGTPLTVQVLIGFGALLAVCFGPGTRTFTRPDLPLAVAVEPLGVFGWGALVLVAGAGVWHARRKQREAVSLILAFSGLLAGVLAASAARRWDEPGRWLSFHVMALAWLGVSGAFLATIKHVKLGAWWLTCFAALLVLCAIHAGELDPWRPWLPAGLAIGAAVALGAVALHTRALAFAYTSGLAMNLAALLVWVAEGPRTVSGFFLTNATGFGVAVAVWGVVRARKRAANDSAPWLEPLDGALVPALAFLLAGLAPTFTGGGSDPAGLKWGAVGAIVVACAVGLWDARARFARPALFAAGTLAVLLTVCDLEPQIVSEWAPRPVWSIPVTALALSAYALGVSCLRLGSARFVESILRLPQSPPAQWPALGLSLLATVTVAFGIHSGLTSAELLSRCANSGAAALLAISFAVLARTYAGEVGNGLRTTAAALVVWCLAALGWAVPGPTTPHVWLHRNAWLFVALVIAAVGGSVAVPRVSEHWRRVARIVGGWAAVAALVVLGINLVQQVPVFDPVKGRTPLSHEAALAILAAVAVLTALALRFALKPDRDPFELRPTRRTAYVYIAELLVVLFFLQIRFNVPGLFRGELAKIWTFVVMALAYAGIGLAEFFERRKVEVLALPLRRTGALLPLVPLLAFWAKPPAPVSEFARDTAPGLEPILGYLEKLPQHFDTYAWLWFLAGGVYGLVALSKRSFGWALLAALATNAALWAALTHGDVPFFVHPQAWVIPLALILLVSEHINRHRLSPEASNTMRYTGVAMIYVASAADMFIAGVGESRWLPVVLAALCVLGVLAGVLLRVRAFIYLGAGFLLLDVFAMIWHAAVNLQQTWVWYASGIVLGVAVLALFTYLEKRRGHVEPEPTERE
ncbi:hypothetical protein R5W23_001114 [Gemmata sp. JC673]|uniref:DUF2157 domain-containing protein n=1 Tax=Gemmata algarum TaxID=2975278 RepID=A0ABU5EXC5_9BACT|nr:hypothetical protein [Gemmata algarum]MDY3559926.1 hypothetical protein [Gemmata algarum]